MKTFKKIKIAIATLAVMVTALAAFGQNNSNAGYQTAFLQLPLSAVATLSAIAGTAGTNINCYGFTGIVGYATNVTGPLYSQATGGFTTAATNVVTNTAMIFPAVYCPTPSTVVLSYRGTTSSQNTNAIFTFANALMAGQPATATGNQINWSVGINQGVGTNAVCLDTLTNQIGYLYLMNEQFQSTNGSVLTNVDGGLFYTVIPNTLSPANL